MELLAVHFAILASLAFGAMILVLWLVWAANRQSGNQPRLMPIAMRPSADRARRRGYDVPVHLPSRDPPGFPPPRGADLGRYHKRR